MLESIENSAERDRGRLDASGRRPSVRRRRRGHRGAVLDIEVRRLERELRWCGPLHRDALAWLCGARNWREGSFDEAIRRGVAAGALRTLPFDYVAVAHRSASP